MAPWQGQGRGLGRGRGRKRGGAGGGGWRHRFFSTGLLGWAREEGWSFQPAAEPELEWLANRAKQLAVELEEVRVRLAELRPSAPVQNRENGETP